MRCGPAVLAVTLASLLAPAAAHAQTPLPPPPLPPGYSPLPPGTLPEPTPAQPQEQQPLYAYFSLRPSSPCFAGRCTATVTYDTEELDRPVLVEADWNHKGAATENFTSGGSVRCLPGGSTLCQLRSPVYRAAGAYTVAVRVTDDAGQTAASQQTIRIISAAAYKRGTSRVNRRTNRRPSRKRGGGGRGGGGGHPLCKNLKAGEQCGAGNGRQTAGGGAKVTHKGWPAVTGVLWKVISMGRGHRARTGGSDNDELLGRHGSDRLNGMGGNDILWGDWDPKNNNTSQHDVLRGGAGNDWLYPSHGSTQVYGGAGNDYVWAYYGHGSIDCGPGKDTARVRLHSRFSLHGCERILHF